MADAGVAGRRGWNWTTRTFTCGGGISKRHILRFEAKHDALLPRPEFARRVARNFGVASALVGVSLAGGMLGYHVTEDMGWIDAFANASMILSGMGPLEPLKMLGGKLFAGAYALDSGLVLVMASGDVLAPSPTACSTASTRKKKPGNRRSRALRRTPVWRQLGSPMRTKAAQY